MESELCSLTIISIKDAACAAPIKKGVMCFVASQTMEILKGRYRLVCTAIIAFYSSYVMACTCMYGGEFREYSQANPVIVKAKVSSYGERLRNNGSYFETMTVEVIEVIKGSIEHAQIELQGDTGMSCFRYISSGVYPISSEHLFSLSNIESTQPLWGCGESSVRIEGSFAEGVGRDGYYKIELDELIELVR